MTCLEFPFLVQLRFINEIELINHLARIGWPLIYMYHKK